MAEITEKEMISMSKIPTPEEAFEILKQYNQEPFHLEHAQIVSKVMGVFAEKHDPERVDFWRTVGMLHDIDFELWPEQHCVKADSLLRELDMNEALIHAVVSHGWGICSDVKPRFSAQSIPKTVFWSKPICPRSS